MPRFRSKIQIPFSPLIFESPGSVLQRSSQSVFPDWSVRCITSWRLLRKALCLPSAFTDTSSLYPESCLQDLQVHQCVQNVPRFQITDPLPCLKIKDCPLSSPVSHLASTVPSIMQSDCGSCLFEDQVWTPGLLFLLLFQPLVPGASLHGSFLLGFCSSQ